MLAIWLHDSSSSSKVDLMISTTPKGHYDHLACQLRRCRVLDVQGPYACRPPLGALSANERERESGNSSSSSSSDMCPHQLYSPVSHFNYLI